MHSSTQHLLRLASVCKCRDSHPTHYRDLHRTSKSAAGEKVTVTASSTSDKARQCMQASFPIPKTPLSGRLYPHLYQDPTTAPDHLRGLYCSFLPIAGSVGIRTQDLTHRGLMPSPLSHRDGFSNIPYWRRPIQTVPLQARR